jgi:hypothetical protein
MLGKHHSVFMGEGGIQIDQSNAVNWSTVRLEQRDCALRTKRGDNVTTVLEMAPILDDDGNYTGAIAGVIDISDRTRNEQLLAVRARQQAALASISWMGLLRGTPDQFFDEAVGEVATAMGVEFVKILELQQDGKSFLLVSGVGWRDGLVGTASVPASTESQAGYSPKISARRPGSVRRRC